MSRTTSTHRFQIQDFSHRPVADINPKEAHDIIGASVTLSATGSTIDGKFQEGMQFTWSVSPPDGSEVTELALIEEDGSQVRLDGDITGTYVVTLVASYEGVESEPVVAGVFFSPIFVPAVKRVVPDGQFMFRVLSDFWKLINDRNVFPVVWSSYTQTVASDLLRALQIDRAKSIRTIQPLFQKRFISFSPKMEIDNTQVNMVLGNHQSGSSAFTGDVTFVDTGVIISPKEFLLLGTASTTAVGANLTLFGEPNAGSYLINRLNASGDGFIISESNPFPDYASTILVSGSDLVSTGGDDLYATTTVLSSASAGDFLRIKEGPSSGFYKIVAVGTADGLTSDRHVTLDSSIASTSNIKFDIFKAVRASYLKADSAFTDTVYIPKDDADLDVFSVESLASNSGEITSDYEIVVDSKHLIDSAIDRKIEITTGSIAGTTFTIAGFNESRTGFLVTEPFASQQFPETVGYRIDVQASVTDRLLVIDGKGHDIASFTLLEDLPTVEEGGRGDLWVVTLAGKTAPSKREGLSWRIGSTIEYEAIEDFPKYGVSAGDQLVFEVTRSDLDKTAKIHATITGAAGNQISFELGTSPVASGAVGTIDPDDALSLSEDLSVPSVALSEVSGEPIYTDTALDIYAFLHSRSFTDAFFNLPLDAETEINVDDFFSIRLKPAYIVRNSAIALDPDDEYPDEPIFSIPSMVEYLTPETGSETDSGYQIVTDDGVVRDFDRAPIKLVENVNYTISSNEIRGAAASTITNSATLTLSDLDLIKNDIRIGDTIELLSGQSAGVYAISSIVSSDTIRVGGRESDSNLPAATESSIKYRITRQVDGRFIRFTTPFAPSSSAPETLWAPIVLVDNFKYIEDNFGVLVGLTKAQMTEFGVSQISYKSAISGLMYCWATGPTFRSVETGAHILLDAAVSETLGQIVEIQEDYVTAGRGRIVMEDLNADGTGKGLYRTYAFNSGEGFNLERFRGLGINPLTSEPFTVGDVVYPFTPLSNSVVVTDRVNEPGWWRKYGTATGETELQKYHTWQAEFDLKTIDSRDIPLAADFLSKIRPIYTKPKIVGVLALRDDVYVEDELYIDMDMFLYDDAAFSRESTHMLDSYNDSGASTRLLDFGSYSTRTLFRGDDLIVEDTDPTLVTSPRGGFLAGSTDAEGNQILPYINASFDEDTFPEGLQIRGQEFVRIGDILYIVDGRNRGRFLVTEIVSDTQIRIAQYVDSAPRGLDPSTHMRSDTGAKFHIQRYEDSLISEGTGISSVGGTGEGLQTDNIIVVDSAAFWSNGVTADDVLIIESGSNRGVYHIEDLGEYQPVPEIFANEETTLTLREVLPAPGDLVDTAFVIRRRVLLENPTFSVSDGETYAAQPYIDSSSNPDLALIAKGDTLVPSTGDDTGVVFRVIGVSGDRIYTDLSFTSSEVAIEFAVHHLDFAQDEPDSDYRLERLHPKDELEITLYRPLAHVYSGTFTLGDNATVSNLIAQATDEAATDLTTVVPPVEVGHLFEVEIDSPDPTDPEGTTDSASHGVYEITQVASDTIQVSQFFPGVQLTSSTDPGVPETGVAASIYAPDANFLVNSSTVDLVAPLSNSLEDLGVVPGDFFENEDGLQYLIVEVAGSTLTLAEDTGVSPASPKAGRILRRPTTFQREFDED